MGLVQTTRLALTDLYALEIPAEQKRARKQALLDSLSVDAGELIASKDIGLSNWLAAPLNNARLVSLGLYEGGQNAFSAILENCEKDLACFYAAAEALADLSAEDRKQELEQLSD